MKLSFKGDLRELTPGIKQLSGELGFYLTEEGVSVSVHKWDQKKLQITYQDGEAHIYFQENIHFFRALGLFLEHVSMRDSFTLEETPQFITNGIMLDCSRNAVMQVHQMKKLVRTMATMGLNMLMLYMEDTYEIEEQPYFGYMRGRYSKEELRDIETYAHQFGVEVIPSIQTLAHLSTFLRWDTRNQYKDTSDILLAGSPDTYELIQQMIESASSPFQSNRIHIGMDEAHLMGKGQYLKKNGYKPTFQIMNDHLNEVLNITREKGLDPMIWSDMYFRMASKEGHYYDQDAIIPKEVIEDMPKDVQFVYWDYYHEDEAVYRDFLRKHKSFGSTPLFAGGLWTWNGISINYNKAWNTLQAALPACKKEGVTEVFATLWGDDGAETNAFSSLLGLQLLAEHNYSDHIDEEKVKRRFQFCTGADADAFLALGRLDQPPYKSKEVQLEPDNPSKFLLWQDPLMGLFDKQVEGIPLNDYYKGLEAELKKAKPKAGEWYSIFDVPTQICSVLSIKSEIGITLKKHYDTKDHQSLENILNQDLLLLKERIKTLRTFHCDEWMNYHKPFGWETLDIRYGGLLARIDTTRRRLRQYLQGEIDSIPELEQEKLKYFNEREAPGFVRSNVYKNIVTPNVF
ncbi:beta-N-acetylhexosaminidase [Pontibacillus sp. HMF3514]|uniref:beta-N-acetylhexosaminidase n=1 Tax=Pontibacillus sp. HMF3514 TaxID=2692425 RepID=UPI00131F5D67|nr:beta-N-acetylhexosaminidase [Pontibacillus sp. HMF3514]QHE52873.1 family 20 glycosylhydrolase [Pontibacillus sp. HMF3514]